MRPFVKPLRSSRGSEAAPALRNSMGIEVVTAPPAALVESCGNKQPSALASLTCARFPDVRRPTGRPADRPTNRPTDRPTDRPTVRPSPKIRNRQTLGPNFCFLTRGEGVYAGNASFANGNVGGGGR